MSSPAAPEGDRYDAIPYQSLPYPSTHPSHLWVLGRLFGLQPPPADRCQVLELGCAAGGNLIPMAVHNPGASFLGLDSNAAMLEEGQRCIDALGLGNIELRHQPLEQLPADQGLFDLVIAHGLYSWVPPDVQAAILNLCRCHLAPQGMAFVSYNALPGWHMRGMVRDLMRYHVRAILEPTKQVAQARALLRFLVQSVTEQSAYGAVLRSEAEFLAKQGDWYLFHDLLAPINEPLLFHQFEARVRAAGLQYLGEPELYEMIPSRLPAAVRKTLDAISPGLIELEQYQDMLREQTFRRSILCHQERRLDRALTWEQLQPFHFATRVSSREPDPDEGPGGIAWTLGPDEIRISSADPAVNAVLSALGEAWPAQLPFQTLLEVSSTTASEATDPEPLGRNLLSWYGLGLIALKDAPFAFTMEPGERPQACPLARWQAQQGQDWLCSRRHDIVRLDGLERALLARCDGQRSRREIIDGVLDASSPEQLRLGGEHAQLPPERQRQLLHIALGARIDALATKALLIS